MQHRDELITRFDIIIKELGKYCTNTDAMLSSAPLIYYLSRLIEIYQTLNGDLFKRGINND